MKFEKTSAVSGLTDDQINAANRFADRRAREEADRRSEYVDPVMRRRVAELFEGLSKSLGARDGRSKPQSWRQVTEVDAEERLGELSREFASAPSVSDEFRRMMVYEPRF